MPDPKIFFETEQVKIIHDDVVATDRVDDSSVDVIVTSPPYNVDIAYN